MHNVKLYGNALGPVYTERQCQRYDNADAPDQFGVGNQCKRALTTMLGKITTHSAAFCNKIGKFLLIQNLNSIKNTECSHPIITLGLA